MGLGINKRGFEQMEKEGESSILPQFLNVSRLKNGTIDACKNRTPF
jgi:hypothetical protein